jgi:hypothetical protein
MPFTDKPPPLPPPSQPFLDQQTGLISGPWYDWMRRLVVWLTKLGAAIP